MDFFTQERRAGHDFLKMLIQEGEQRIPIQLEEMIELKQLEAKI